MDRVRFKHLGRNCEARVFDELPQVETFEPGCVTSQFLRCDELAGATYNGPAAEDGQYDFYIVDELFSNQIDSMDEYDSNHEEYYIAVFTKWDDDDGEQFEI